MENQDHAEKVVDLMLEKDEFSRWLGINIIELKPGYCKAEMKIRKDMLNGFDICHGGVTFSLADSVFAFASNGHGRLAVALETNITFLNPVHLNDIITAEAVEEKLGNNVGVYNIHLVNQNGHKVAIFRGTVFRTKKKYFENE